MKFKFDKNEIKQFYYFILVILIAIVTFMINIMNSI